MRLKDSDPELVETLRALERRADAPGAGQHLRLRADLGRVLQHAIQRGDPLVDRVRRLRRKLDEDAFDEMFDNMPI
ncbi:hypothetical protein KDD17_16760 [Sulfitobacter albidus]|uniref:Uncharacterized protein n=1 Tax=Sulfitobacter albidus TaxID=2829501 RepID=A0A975JDJ1_9RHOB|nr:hypothetical protein [Sulfitobacter albidus]QUJ76499.1 hypothetical protein KDD17_16760 [Sulfitobacter albidus]